MNAYLEEFHPDTEEQEIAPLPEDDIMDIIYHSMPTTWKNKMIEQGFNCAYSTVKEKTDFFETRVEILEYKEDKKKSSAATKKSWDKTFTKKWNRADSNSSVVKFSKESSVEHREVKNTLFYMENAVTLQTSARI